MTNVLYYGDKEVRYDLDEGRVESLAKSMVVSVAEARGGEGTLPTEDDRAAAVATLRGTDDEAADMAASLDLGQFRFG
jgi:hypothetical protein